MEAEEAVVGTREDVTMEKAVVHRRRAAQARYSVDEPARIFESRL